MKRLELTAETRRMFDDLKNRRWPVPAYGMKHEKPWASAWRVLKPLLNRAGRSRTQQVQYRAAAHEFICLFRTETGAELVAGIEQTLLRWQAPGFGLDLRMLEQVALTCYERCLALLRPGPKPKALGIVIPTKRTRPGRTYEQMLRHGRVPRNEEATIPEQTERYQQAMRKNSAISRKVRQALVDHGVPLKEFIRYNAFAYRLSKRARRYSGKTLRLVALDLVDQWEAKGQNRGVLLAIARSLGIELGTG
jgi:hypothetical protein